MNNHSKEKDQDRELFKRAISEALDLKMQEIDEEIKNVELPSVFPFVYAEMHRYRERHSDFEQKSSADE